MTTCNRKYVSAEEQNNCLPQWPVLGLHVCIVGHLMALLVHGTKLKRMYLRYQQINKSEHL